eukprot:124456-Chlamydomonas_euryale.AAC.1
MTFDIRAPVRGVVCVHDCQGGLPAVNPHEVPHLRAAWAKDLPRRPAGLSCPKLHTTPPRELQSGLLALKRLGGLGGTLLRSATSVWLYSPCHCKETLCICLKLFHVVIHEHVFVLPTANSANHALGHGLRLRRSGAPGPS